MNPLDWVCVAYTGLFGMLTLATTKAIEKATSANAHVTIKTEAKIIEFGILLLFCFRFIIEIYQLLNKCTRILKNGKWFDLCKDRQKFEHFVSDKYFG
ncbi:MAG: hypothetical protein WCO19_02285 [Candidatus Saccharibacteria bacterium]